jgi:hypothetical protein
MKQFFMEIYVITLTAFEITSLFITAKICHPEHTIVYIARDSYGTPYQMKIPALVKLTETPD